MKTTSVDRLLVSPSASVRAVIEIIDKAREGVAFVVNQDNMLLGTLTDGDIRRFMLSGRALDEPCSSVMCSRPVTASVGQSIAELRQMMSHHRIQHIPVIDENRIIRSFFSARDFLGNDTQSLMAVVMAGGEGKRLWPITENIPKPMIEVGGKPMLHSIVEALQQAGVADVYLSVNYRAEVIQKYFGDGSGFGVNISYIYEKQKMGTAGALSLLPEVPKEPFIVMNGDVMTNINFGQFLDFHRYHRSLLTIAASEYHLKIPFGVLELGGHFVLNVQEKPTHSVFCNSGIYVLDPDVLRLVPKDSFYDMPTLVQSVIGAGLPTAAFPIREYWIDIGRKDDLDKACNDATALGIINGD